MTKTLSALNHLQHVFFFSCLQRCYSLFSSVESGLNNPCNFHQANKGKQWYKSVKSARHFLHLTLCFAQACADPLLNAGKAAIRFEVPLCGNTWSCVCAFLPHWFLGSKISDCFLKNFPQICRRNSVTIVAYYDIQKEQLTIWDAKNRPKCMHAGMFFSVCFFFFIDSRMIIRFIVSN